jgi:hypothetical protein
MCLRDMTYGASAAVKGAPHLGPCARGGHEFHQTSHPLSVAKVLCSLQCKGEWVSVVVRWSV